MLSQNEVSEAAKNTDAEDKVIELYKKIMEDKNLSNNTVVFSNVTALELASALHAAWGTIDILKFELGE